MVLLWIGISEKKMFLNGPFFVDVILDIIYYVCQIFWHGKFSFLKKFPFCCMNAVETFIIMV